MTQATDTQRAGSRARDVFPRPYGLMYVSLHIAQPAKVNCTSAFKHAACGTSQDRKGAKARGLDGLEADDVPDGTRGGGTDGNVVKEGMGRGPSATATGSAPPEPLDRATRRRQRQAERDAADALKRRQRARRCALHSICILCAD